MKMKKLFILIAVAFCFSSPALAINKNFSQTAFSFNTNTIIFLNCYSTDKNVIEKYQDLKKEMEKEWTPLGNPGISTFFMSYPAFSRQILNVYVGGFRKPNGDIGSSTNFNNITSRYQNMGHRSFVSIKNTKGTIIELLRMIK